MTRPPLACPQFFLLAIRRYQSYFSHIRKKSQKQRYNNTHMVQPWLPRPAKQTTVEPRKNNNKLSFVGVRCSSCKQIQKKPRRSWRGDVKRPRRFEDWSFFFSSRIFTHISFVKKNSVILPLKKKSPTPLYNLLSKESLRPLPSAPTTTTHLLIFFGFPPNFIRDLQLKKNLAEKIDAA